jgi:hypothetical protein
MEPAMAGIFSLQFGRGFLRSIKSEPALVDKPAAFGMDAGECPSPAEMDLAQFLSRFSHLPKLTLPIGINEDCNPVLFDMKDPRPGPILVIGDDPEANTNFLRLLASAVDASEAASDTKFMVITPQPEQWKAWIGALKVPECCLGVLSIEDGEADEWVIRLAERVEQRLNGRHMNGPILFMIDNFEFITHTDTDVRLNFEWLCNNGPDAQIWPVFTLPTIQALEMGRWIRYFRTRLIGRITNPAAGRLSIYGGLNTEDFDSKRQFAIRIQDRWLSFWLPILDPDAGTNNEETEL